MEAVESLFGCLEQVSDPRRARGVRHPFQAILRLTLLGLVCGQTTMAHIALFARMHWPVLKEPLGFLRDQPPHATTISRTLAGVSYEQLQDALTGWVAGVVSDQEMNASVDGKWARQSEDARGNPLVMVNVLAHDLKLCLAQWPASEKRYEPGVLREELGQLLERYPGLKLLTMDALYAERDLCQAIVSHGRDYLVRIKGNQPEALSALAEGFAGEELGEPAAETVEKSWGDRAAAHLDGRGTGQLHPGRIGLSWGKPGGDVGEGDGEHSHWGNELGALVPADQPEFPAVCAQRAASGDPQPLDGREQPASREGPQLARRRPHPAPSGPGRGVCQPGQHSPERPAPRRMVSSPNVHATASQVLRLPTNSDHRTPLR